MLQANESTSAEEGGAVVRPNIVPLALLAVPLLLAGCEEMNCEVVEALPGGPRAVPPSTPVYLGLGDSIIAMNAFECRGIMAYAGLDLGAYIEDRSRGGHCLTHPPDGIDIMHQYTHGPWEWVILNGGGNDMLQDCACSFAGHDPNACRDVMDSLALPAARTGDLFQFIDMVKADTNDTASILIIGYYSFPESSMEDLNNCNPYIAEMYLRYQQVADQYENVFLLDTREVMDFDAHPEYFAIDHDHPSYEGSAAVGRMAADLMRSQLPSCADLDGDGYGDPAGPACAYPEPDCDDSNPQINPGVAENCLNGADDDCDGLTDLEDAECRECTAPEECSDGNPCTDDDCVGFACVYTNNAEPCDDADECTMDDTCSGGVCRGDPLDADRDAHVSDACGGGDCNDSNPDVNPGATEGPAGDATCSDGSDNDCDQQTDQEDSGCIQ
jgi:lysophospholipase L1-like esterase